MEKKIGFIGGGNMAQAMISGILSAGVAKPEQLFCFDANENTLKTLKERHGICIAAGNVEVTKTADILILAVKPQVQPAVIKEIRDAVRPETIVVSIAAGRKIADIESDFNKEIKLVRVMPNTSAMVGEAMSGLSGNSVVKLLEVEEIKSIFNSFGKAEIVPESLMDTVVAVSGSSPAYVYLFIEAMADAAVAGGMPRAQAYTFAAQSVLGAAKMVLESGKHPGELKDMVCSPAGTTIEAVASLERDGFRGIVIDAVQSCMDRSKEL